MIEFDGMREAEVRSVRGITIFEFPLPDPMSGGDREAVRNPEDPVWRWRDNGYPLERYEFKAIEAELARRTFEKEIQDEEICRRAGI